MQVQYFQSAAAMSIFAQKFRAEETDVERFVAAQTTLSKVREIIETQEQIETTQIASKLLNELLLNMTITNSYSQRCMISDAVIPF